MYQNKKVIDIHGHMSTPPHFRAFAYNMIALRGMGGGKLVIPDDAMAGASERHLRMLDERNIDVQMISPRPVAMMHWERPFLVDEWTVTTNDCIAQISRLSKDRFVGIAQLPQHQSLATENCVAELDRCINELGLVGATVESGYRGRSKDARHGPGLLVPALQARSRTEGCVDCAPVHHARSSTGSHSSQLPVQQHHRGDARCAPLEHSNVFERFPDLKIIVCHCGGALRRMMNKGTRPGVKPDGTLTKLEVRESGEMAGGSVGLGVARDQEKRPSKISATISSSTRAPTIPISSRRQSSSGDRSGCCRHRSARQRLQLDQS